MIRYFFLCLTLLLTGVIIQQWIPAMGSHFYGARILVVPLFFFCIAHAQPYTPTLIFAFIAGGALGRPKHATSIRQNYYRV